MRILRSIIGFAVVVLTLGALAGFWVYFEYMAPIVPGTILDKQERIIGGRHATPGRYLSTSFTLQDETEETRYLYGSPLVTDIRVDEQTYESAIVGAAVNVKYLPINPRTARLVGQPLLPQAFWMFMAAVLLSLGAVLIKRTRLAVVLSVGFAAAVLVATPGPPSARFALSAAAVLSVLVVVAALSRRGSARVLVSVWVLAMLAIAAWPIARASSSPTMTASAEIREVHAFRTPRSSRARYAMMTLQEFDRVHASFVPQGATQPVFMVDFVDRDSATTLSEGARATVEYSADNPQGARLVQRTRTHYWKNAAVPVGAVLGAAWLTTRTRQPKKQKRGKAQTAAPPQGPRT